MADKQKKTLKIEEPRPRNSHADLSLPLSVILLRMKLDDVAHAVKCQSSRCQHQNCDVAKKLFRHFVVCRRGCRSFNRMRRLIRVHIKACRESNCNCRDLAECLRKLRQKHESRRMLREQVKRLGGLQLQQPGWKQGGAAAPDDAVTSLVTSLDNKARIF